jgi:hypothetical protein
MLGGPTAMQMETCFRSVATPTPFMLLTATCTSTEIQTYFCVSMATLATQMRHKVTFNTHCCLVTFKKGNLVVSSQFVSYLVVIFQILKETDLKHGKNTTLLKFR